MKKIKNLVLQTIAQHNLIPQNSNVIVALSGGADSVALFHFLYTHKTELGITVQAAHVNHGLRGANADNDEAFVTNLCKQYDVVLHKAHLPPPQTANEEWARNQRYAFFASLANTHTARIATAHTASDNAETVLFRLARGTGSAGLCGIPYQRDCYIRPFLALERADIEQYCTFNALEYVTDETNLTPRYARNVIRLQALPALEQAHAGASLAIHRFTEQNIVEQDYLTQQATKLLEKAKINDNTYSVQAFNTAHKALCHIALRILIGQCTNNPQQKHIALLQNALLQGHGGTQVAPNANWQVKGDVLQKTTAMPQNITAQSHWQMPFTTGEIALPNGDKLYIEIKKDKNSVNYANVGKKSLIFVADYDKIKLSSVFRYRAEGDTFTLPTRNITKSLKKLFNEEKIAPTARNTLPLLAHNNQVFWLAGFGFAKNVQANSATKQFITITYNKR